MLEQKKDIATMIELGGGYGGLARIAKMIFPDITYVILDLPESIAIQSLFLKLSIPEDGVIIHADVPFKLKEGVVNLIPIHYLDSLNFKADVFISNFALSETTELLQKRIIEKSFFGVSLCYLTGQINIVPHHSILMDAVRKNY